MIATKPLLRFLSDIYCLQNIQWYSNDRHRLQAYKFYITLHFGIAYRRLTKARSYFDTFGFTFSMRPIQVFIL